MLHYVTAASDDFVYIYVRHNMTLSRLAKPVPADPPFARDALHIINKTQWGPLNRAALKTRFDFIESRVDWRRGHCRTDCP